MKIMKVSLLLLIILGLTFSVAFAKNTCRKKEGRPCSMTKRHLAAKRHVMTATLTARAWKRLLTRKNSR